MLNYALIGLIENEFKDFIMERGYEPNSLLLGKNTYTSLVSESTKLHRVMGMEVVIVEATHMLKVAYVG